MTAPAARADNHWQVTYACSHSTSTSGTGDTYWLPESDAWTDTTPGEGVVADMGDTDDVYSASSSDTVTATLTWVDDSGNPVTPGPKCVLVQEQATAECSTANTTDSLGSYSASNGLGDAVQNLDNPDTIDPYTYPAYDRISGVPAGGWLGEPLNHYSVHDGTSGTITLSSVTLSASVSSTPAPPSDDNSGTTEAGADTNYAVAAWPITIDLSGVTPDPDVDHLKLLTGQQVSATLNLNGAPGVINNGDYQWSAGGDTFETYDTTAPNTQHATQLVPLSAADKAQSDFNFYDKKAETLTVTCTAIFTATDGTAITLIPESRTITVLKPTVSWAVGNDLVGGTYTPGFFADPNAPPTFIGAQETWGPIQIDEPALFTNNGSPTSVGFGVLVQIASPTTNHNGLANNFDNFGVNHPYAVDYNKFEVINPDGTSGHEIAATGLDGGFPYLYGFYIDADSNWVTVTPDPNLDFGYGWLADDVGYSADVPRASFVLPGSGIVWNEADASESFDTWVMYRPASVSGSAEGTVYVPLQKLTWSWGGSASKDSFGDDWSTLQSQPFVPGSPSDTDTPPSWSLRFPLNPTIGP